MTGGQNQLIITTTGLCSKMVKTKICFAEGKFLIANFARAMKKILLFFLLHNIILPVPVIEYLGFKKNVIFF